MNTKDTHCSHCGEAYPSLDYPRRCSRGHLLFENPTAVVVVLQPVFNIVEDRTRSGMIIAKRAIQPAKGEWSLISGYMGKRETAEDAARREFKEETGLDLTSEPRYCYSSYNDHGLLMLCFCVDPPMRYSEFLTGKPCHENEELGVYWFDDPIDLAFPLQSEFARKWLAGDFDRGPFPLR